MTDSSLDALLAAARKRSEDPTDVPDPMPSGCLSFFRARVLALDPDRASEWERDHAASCRRCRGLVAAFSQEVPHLSLASLVRRRLGLLSAEQCLAAEYHLERAGCRECRARDRRLGELKESLVRFAVPGPAGVRLPHPVAAGAATAGFHLEAASPDGTVDAELAEEDGQVVLEVRTKDPARSGGLVGYVLRGTDDQEERGYLVLSPDVQGWHAGATTWSREALYAVLQGTCTELLVYPADLSLLGEVERESLTASAVRDKHQPGGRAAWLAWVTRTEAQHTDLSPEAGTLLSSLRRQVESA